MNDTASAAPVRDYPTLPDFETVEQHIYGACRRYITQDMLEPIHNLIRDAIDADRAMRAQAAPAAVASPLTKLQRKAIAVCFTSEKVSVSEVQRKLSISYADAQTLCQSIVDLGLTDELELAPSLKRGAPAPHPAPVAQGDALDAEVKEMREALIDAAAHLIGAASAYEKYAKRFGGIKPKAVIDPFFETRHMDFHEAAGRAQAYLNKARWKHD